MNILDLIFPRRCLGCGKLGKYFCDRCRLTIRAIGINEAICPVCQKLAVDGATHPGCQTRYTSDGLTSFFRYDGIIKKAVKTIKYRFVSNLADEFVSLIPQISIQAIERTNNSAILIPIPLHPSRYRFRGFNQAEVLGKLIASGLDIPMETHLLNRIKKTIPQVEMKDREERLKNMEKVFAFSNTATKQRNNSVVFLFDDVFTTGATLRSAASVLKHNGFLRVWGITMAR